MKAKTENGLTADSQRLFDRVRKEWSIVDEPGLTLLRTALQSWDEMRQAQEVLRAEGTIIKDRFGIAKLHPAAQREKESRAHFYQGMKALNLDLNSLGE